MKETFFLIIIIISSFLLEAQTQSSDSLVFKTEKGAYIQLRGKIKDVKRQKADRILIMVCSGDSTIYGNYQRRGRFRIYLPVDTSLTLEVLRKGYYPKRININTNLPNTEDKEYLLIFEFHMIEKRNLYGLDDFVFEFPAGFVEFDLRKNNFVYSERYTQNIFKKINNVLDEAEKRRLEEEAKSKN